MTALWWIKDFRLSDNPALRQALWTRLGGHVVPLAGDAVETFRQLREGLPFERDPAAAAWCAAEAARWHQEVQTGV